MATLSSNTPSLAIQKDLDLWISTDPANAEAVYKALREFGAPLAGLTADDFAEEGYFYQMGMLPVRVDEA